MTEGTHKVDQATHQRMIVAEVLRGNHLDVVPQIGIPVAEAMALLASTMPPGCFVEIGVYRGGTAQYLYRVAQQQGRQVHLFDTFAGTPYRGPDDIIEEGDFNETSRAQVQNLMPKARLYPGVFPETMPDEFDLNDIAFCHIDCDQYEGVKAAGQLLEPRMVPGGIMWFDDYVDLQGARKAIEELYAGRIIKYKGKALVQT